MFPDFDGMQSSLLTPAVSKGVAKMAHHMIIEGVYGISEGKHMI
jgi:hypothetical protein